MFYSHELLGRKTPLGAIWTLAHGRKLSKGRITSINVREICDEIMQPGVPHSLRLQGILVGGVVMVFSKQQTYLLEDLQEMMRRVKAASDTAAAGGAAKAEKGKTKGKGKQVDGGNNQARLEAITLTDMEDLLAPAAYGDDDILGLLAGGSLSDALASQGALHVDRMRLPGGAELAGDLFIMPSLGGGATSEGGDTDAQGRPISKQGSRGTGRTGSGRHQEEEVYGGLNMMQHDWLNPEDEVFADPADLDLDLLGGMDLPQPVPAGSDRSRDQTTSQQQKQATSGNTTNGAAGAGAQAAAGDVRNEYDDEMFMMDTLEVPYNPQEEQQEGPTESDQQQGRDQGDTGGAVEGMRKVKQRKRKAGQLLMDDLDNLLIKTKVYREWCTDSSPLMNAALKNGQVLQAHTSPATPLGAIDTFAGFGGAPFAGIAGAAGVVALCPELAALLKAPAEAAAEHDGAGKGRPYQPGSPEVNNSTGKGSLPGMLPYAHKMPLDLHTVLDGDRAMMQDDDLMMDFPPPPHEDQEALSNDEAHDQLGDLPFNGDIEIERMRAAVTPGSSDGSLRDMFPGGSTATMRMAAGRDSNATSAGGSSLAGARAHLAGSSDLGGTRTKRRLGSADLGATDDLDIFFGTGNLADLLPDIEAEQFYDGQQQADEGPLSEDLDNAVAGRRSGSLPGSDRERSLTPYNSSQFPLLEETEPDQPTQTMQDQASLSRTTRVALSIFQERLQRSTEQQQAEAGASNDAAGAAAAGPSVSFFGLIKEGRLSRNQAATLFYQVCVTSTAGFVSADQDRAYGDIMIKQGIRAF